MPNIFDDSYSDTTSTKNRRLSRPVTMTKDMEENDDNKEKKDKRKSIIIENGDNLRMAAIMPGAPNPQLASGLTEEQLSKHYGNCIKLASENKITQNNAFSLHLIDYLSDYLKELENFQTVGASLDAGTKIYAGRVDSIHKNTYQVLTGLGNPNEVAEQEPEAEILPDELVEEEDQDAKIKKVKRKAYITKSTICQNLRKIRLLPSQIRSEVDPLFQSQAENFDEGGNCDLRLNNLQLLDKTYELLLDSEKIVYTNRQEKDSTDNEPEMDYYNIDEFEEMFKEIADGPIPISSQFEDFMFMGWNVGSEKMNSTTAESFRNMLKMEESKMEEVINEEPVAGEHNDFGDDCGGDYDDDDYGYDDVENLPQAMQTDVSQDLLTTLPKDLPQAMDVDGPQAIQQDLPQNNEEEIQGNKTDDEDDNLVTIGSNKTDSYVGNMLMSSVRNMVHSVIEFHGEVNDNLIGMWAGPNYWKQKAKPIKIKGTEVVKKVPINTKPSKEIKAIFPENIETGLNDDGIGRMVIEDIWNFNKSDQPSTQLTDICLTKNIQKEYLLPPRTLFSFKSLNQLMNREVSLVNKVLKKQTDKMPCAELDDDDKVLNYDYNNNNDVIEFCPFVADEEGHVTVNNDADPGFDDYDDYDDGDAYMGTSFNNNFHDAPVDENGAEDDLDPITANVKLVAKIDIDYAKNAKRINVKKLKNEIWSSLEKSIHAVDTKTMLEKFPKLHKTSEVTRFSDMLATVDRNLSADASRDLSVSILLTCLLHLSNEAGLDISNTDDFADLMIGQGYSEYDIVQINEFGKGNCLLNETRKRKSSLDQSGGPPNHKLHHQHLFADHLDNDDNGNDEDDGGDDLDDM